MIINDLKADLGDAVKEKVKTVIEQTVEKKVRYEVKKAVRKLTVKLIVAGVALAGVAVLASNVGKAGKAVGLLKDKNEK